MKNDFAIDGPTSKKLIQKWINDQDQIYVQQCLALIKGFREKIKCYSTKELLMMKGFMKNYLFVENESLLMKSYMQQIESQIKSKMEN
jgi:hypothetical protein